MMNLRHSKIGIHHLDSLSCEVFWQTLVTGDADMIPLARALMKHGVRVVVAHFDYKTEKDHQFANERLLAACNYTLNINQMERDKDFKTSFKMLFRKAEPKPST